MAENNKVFKPAVLVTIGQIFVASVSFFSFFYLATIYPKEIVGYLSVIIFSLNIAQLLVGLRLGESLSYFVPKYINTDAFLAFKFINTTFLINLTIGLLSSMVVFFLKEGIAVIIDKPDLARYINISFILITLYPLKEFFIYMLRSLKRYTSLFFLYIADASIQFFFIFLIVSPNNEISYIYSLILSATAFLTLAIVVSLKVYKSYNIKSFAVLSYTEITSFLSYTKYLVMSSITSIITKRFDEIVLIGFAGPVAIAIYSLPKKILQAITLLLTGLSFVLLPNYVTSFENKDIKSLNKMLYKTTIYPTLVFVPLISLILFVSSLTITYFLPTYAASYPLIVALSYYGLTYVISAGVTPLVLAESNTKTHFYYGLLQGLLNILLSIVLIKVFGLLGVAFSLLLSFIISFLYLLTKINNQIHYPLIRVILLVVVPQLGWLSALFFNHYYSLFLNLLIFLIITIKFFKPESKDLIGIITRNLVGKRFKR